MTLTKHHSDSQQTFDSEQSKRLKKCQKAPDVDVTLLRQQVSNTKCRNNEYKYTTRPTIWTR